MSRTITLKEADSRFADVVRQLENSDEPMEIEEDGKTVAVLLSPEEFRAYNWERAWKVIGAWRERNADKTSDEIYREITEIVEEVRQEMHEEKLPASGVD